MPFFILYVDRLDSSQSKSFLPFWALPYSILNYHVSKYGILTWALMESHFAALIPDRGWNLPPPLYQFIAKKTIFQI